MELFIFNRNLSYRPTVPMQALCVKNDHRGGCGQNTDESQTLKLCFLSLSLSLSLALSSEKSYRVQMRAQKRELWRAIEYGKSVSRSLWYISLQVYVWNYIPTIYYAAGKKKGLCWIVFGRAYHWLISFISKLSTSTDVAVLVNFIPSWQHTRRKQPSLSFFCCLFITESAVSYTTQLFQVWLYTV